MYNFITRYCACILAGWAVGVGSLLLAVSNARFSSPQWKFVMNFPGDQRFFGALFLFGGLAMALGLVKNRWRLSAHAANGIGSLNIVFATILGAASLSESHGGVMGLPTFGLIGVMYLVVARLLKGPHCEYR